MTIENSTVVDAIGTERESGCVVLTITDHLEADSEQHLVKLQDKLNAYFAFIESGQIFEAYPSAKGAQLRIDIWCKHAPPGDVSALVERANRVARQLAVEVTIKTR